MKKILVLILSLALLIPTAFASAASAASAASIQPDSNIKVYLDGERLFFDIDPAQTQGTTLVQFTTIFNAVGLEYKWDPATKSINGYNDDLAVRLTINDKIANVNGYNIELNVAPMVYAGKTLVPLRFISETTGMKVTWHSSTKTINIDSDPDGKVIAEPNLDLFFLGTDWGDSSKVVESIQDGVASKPYGDISTYNNINFFGYDSELNFTYIYDELSSISYYQGKDGLDDNYFVVYSDIYEGLEANFGVPNAYNIYEGLYQEGYDATEVDWDINPQLLAAGIEDGDYQILASWDLPHTQISLSLYKDTNNDILIETLFSPTY